MPKSPGSLTTCFATLIEAIGGTRRSQSLEVIDTLFAEELTLRENRRVKMADPGPAVCRKPYCGSPHGCDGDISPSRNPNYRTVRRRFQTWCCHEFLRLV